MVEDGLADAHGLGSDLDELVLLDILQALLEAHDDLGDDAGLLVGAGGTDVGELLGLADIDDEVVVVDVFADDLTHIDVLTGVDEELATVLQLVDGIGEGIAGFEGNHRAVDTALDVALVGLVFLEAVGHDGFALRGCEDVGAESDDAA